MPRIPAPRIFKETSGYDCGLAAGTLHGDRSAALGKERSFPREIHESFAAALGVEIKQIELMSKYGIVRSDIVAIAKDSDKLDEVANVVSTDRRMQMLAPL